MACWSFVNIGVDGVDDNLLVKQLIECAGTDMNESVFIGDGTGTWHSPFDAESRIQYMYSDGRIKAEELFYLINILVNDEPFELFFADESADNTSDSGERIEKLMKSKEHVKMFCSFTWEAYELHNGGEIEIKTQENFNGRKPNAKSIKNLIKKANELGYSSLAEKLSEV